MTVLDDMNPFLSVVPPAIGPAVAILASAAATSAAASTDKPDAAADFHSRPPPGYVLIERELLARTVERLKAAAERERKELFAPPLFLRRHA